jgi:malonate decarboxylase alpha subunit
MDFTQNRKLKQKKLDSVSKLLEGKWVTADNIVALLQALIAPQDRVCLEGGNQKQAEFLVVSILL